MEKPPKHEPNFPSDPKWPAFKFRSFVRLLGLFRPQSPVSTFSRLGSLDSPLARSKSEHGSSLHIPMGLQMIRDDTEPAGIRPRYNSIGEINDGKKGQEQEPHPPNPTWASWIVGSLLTLLLPFLKLQWGSKLPMIEGEAEMVIAEVEKVAEVVEKVANVAEKVSEEVAESIPADNSKLKEAALWVERASKAAAHDARLTQDVIHKVDALEHDVSDLETIAEPLIGKITH